MQHGYGYWLEDRRREIWNEYIEGLNKNLDLASVTSKIMRAYTHIHTKDQFSNKVQLTLYFPPLDITDVIPIGA